MWIHEHKNWPHFTWNSEALASRLGEVRHQQGRLVGRMEGLGFEFRREVTLKTLTDDVVKSWAIEGENLNWQEVRSSVARRLGMDRAGLTPVSRHVEGIVEMMMNAVGEFADPLTRERLFNWHGALFPTGRSGMRQISVAAWRKGPMEVISGPIGREKIHFKAPHEERVETEINTFLSWFENENAMDPVLKAGLAHFWFVTIHPFEDGNGRIARAIGDMALARADGTANRCYGLSAQIESNRKDYYLQLERQQRATPDVTDWLRWFLSCLNNAIKNSENKLNAVVFKVQLWEKINQHPVNERQRLVINRMLADNFQGHMSTSKYAKLVKCSSDTALRDIQDLKTWGIFIQNPGRGRSTSYRLLPAKS